MTLATLLLLAFATSAPVGAEVVPDDVMRISAELPADLAEGAAAELALTVEIADGWSSAGAGVPRPILQIGVPPSITLAGKVLSTRQELARNEFLRAPFERQIEPGTTTVALTLAKPPAPDERLALNVVAYVANESADEAVFVRRRVELPVRAGASASSSTQSERSDWSGGEGLQIGDTAPDFTLPRADGATVRLADLRAGGSVIVTTYRAFW